MEICFQNMFPIICTINTVRRFPQQIKCRTEDLSEDESFDSSSIDMRDLLFFQKKENLDRMKHLLRNVKHTCEVQCLDSSGAEIRTFHSCHILVGKANKAIDLWYSCDQDVFRQILPFHHIERWENKRCIIRVQMIHPVDIGKRKTDEGDQVSLSRKCIFKR